MPRIDHHSKPYDAGTIFKLELFENYVEVWLPTFIMQKNVKEVNIVDFFAGIGYDKSSVKGSPIRILDKIDYFNNLLTKNHTNINLYFNEYDKSKFELLKSYCSEYLDYKRHLKPYVKLHFSNLDFNDIYQSIVTKTRNSPNLYILDQNGIKFTCQENFNTLLDLERTDFLFFISSSSFERFGQGAEFSRHLEISEKELKENPHNFIHRVVLDTYRKLIPSDSSLRIFPFSLKKKANIYGLIFGSKHIVGVEKFLKIAWDKNKVNGEANYDIDDDTAKSQLVLNFDNPNENKQLTKIELFEKKIEEYIQKHKVVTNRELYYLTYENGFIAKHTSNCVKKLKSDKQISYHGHPKISWNKVRNNDIVEFKWKK